ncbi:MAG: hypothetical protein R3231_08625 [bacterium]|nr:hypothetical protein [bacterium]
MKCTKCGSKMYRDDTRFLPLNRDEGGAIFFDVYYKCPLCSKVLFLGLEEEMERENTSVA